MEVNNISYLVCHMEKYHKQSVSPVEEENERDENYQASNPQIDRERTRENYHIVKRDMSYTEYINQRIESLNLKSKPRKDAVVMNSFVIGSDKDFFNKRTVWDANDFFTECTNFFARTYGEENIISAVVHNDETTPHLHLNLIPITKDGRLCSKDLFDKNKLSKLQTDLYQEVGRIHALLRGKEGSEAKHLSTAEYKAKKIIEKAEATKKETDRYALALLQAERGDIPRDKHKLREMLVATLVENKDLKERLNTSMEETLTYGKENDALKEQHRKVMDFVDISIKLKEENPNEFYRIKNKQKVNSNMGQFFNSVLSLFTPSITSQSNRLQEIEEELKIEQEKEQRKYIRSMYNTFYK